MAIGRRCRFSKQSSALVNFTISYPGFIFRLYSNKSAYHKSSSTIKINAVAIKTIFISKLETISQFDTSIRKIK
jgi:hypothetical protein